MAQDGNSSKARFEVEYNQRLKKRFLNQGPPNTPRVNKGIVSSPKTLDGKGGGPYVDKLFVISVVKNMNASA